MGPGSSSLVLGSTDRSTRYTSEPPPGERFEVDWGHFGVLDYAGRIGKSVPEALSVIGFDDIQSAAYQNPGLTTIRQPLREMGMTAAETLVRRISAPKSADYPKNIVVEPELIVRGSTARPS